MKSIILSLFAFLAILTVALPVNNYAAQFIGSDETGNIMLTDQSKRYENVYAGGNNITIKTPIFKDLFIGGTNITIESNIERSLFAGASNITIKNSTIGAGVKIGGSNITLENVKIEDDVFIGAGNVTINNATINGDLLVSAGNITMTNSTVSKNMYYSGPKNDTLKPQVKGELKIDSDDNKAVTKNDFDSKDKSSFFGYWNAASILSSLVILLSTVFVLNKYKRLSDSNIGFDNNGKSFLHLGYGAMIIAIIIVLIILAFVSLGLLAPFAINLTGLLILLMVFITPLSAYYLTNLIFRKHIKWWYVLLVFLAIQLLMFIPFIGGIVGVIMFFVNLMTFGYYLSKFVTTIKHSLEHNHTSVQ